MIALWRCTSSKRSNMRVDSREQIKMQNSPDGQRFIIAEPLGDPETPEASIHVGENWFAEFQDQQAGAR